MSDIPRREIEELISRYQLHPNLKDIYVEGDYDKEFIQQFLEHHEFSDDFNIYTIDTINIPVDLIEALELNAGSNKYRVVALSKELEKSFPNEDKNIVCLIDVDTDIAANALHSGIYLKYTDYVCMEMYSFNSRTLAKFIEFVANLRKGTHLEFINLAKNILPCIFAVRVLNETEKLGIAIPSFTTGCDNVRIESFDANKYFDFFINFGGLRNRRAYLSASLKQIYSNFSADIRDKSNGHDFIELLFHFLWSKGSLKLQDKQNSIIRYGSRLVSAAVDYNALTREPFFAHLESLQGA